MSSTVSRVNLGQRKDIAVRQFPVVMMIVSGHSVFFVDLAQKIEFDKPGGAVRHMAEAVGTGHDVAVAQTLDVEHRVHGQQPADIAHVVKAHGKVFARRGQEHEVVPEVIH